MDQALVCTGLSIQKLSLPSGTLQANGKKV